MKQIVKYCKECEKKPTEYRKYFDEYFTECGLPKDFVDLGVVGYYTVGEDEHKDFCQVHLTEKLEISSLNTEEYDIISTISTDLTFIHAMEELKQSDPIEFQLKLSQFKTSVDVQEQIEKQSDNRPKCPTCGSTKLSKVLTVSKAGSVFMFGLLSQKVKKTWHCENCKYEW